MSVNGLLNNVQGISNLPAGAAASLGRLESGSFWSQLRPASYRGVGFGVLGGSASFGRRNAVHEYPFRDTPWVEDLGMSARHVHVTGFLVGDDVIAQRAKLIEVCEKPGDGELVHPTLGRMQVALIGMSASESWEQGRVFEIQLSFVVQGQRLFPQAKASAADAAGAAAAELNKSGVSAFVSRAVSALRRGAAVASAAADQSRAYAGRAQQVITDATSLFKLAVQLPGEHGRLLGQAAGINPRAIVRTAASMTVDGLTGAAAAARMEVAIAAKVLADAGTGLGADTSGAFAEAGQGLAAAVAAASPTPGEAVRALLAMAAFPAVADRAGDALVAQLAAGDAFRRAVVAELATVAAQYEPASADEAVSLRDQVLAAVDTEMTMAGDQGEDAVYAALRKVRRAVVQGMAERGAGLPTLRDVRTMRPMPSLVLSQRLYRDAGRADELVSAAGPAHPAFMPTAFRALNA